jgi:hypothetical protein
MACAEIFRRPYVIIEIDGVGPRISILEIDRCDCQAIQYLYAGIRFGIRRETSEFPTVPSVQISDTCDLPAPPAAGLLNRANRAAILAGCPKATDRAAAYSGNSHCR